MWAIFLSAGIWLAITVPVNAQGLFDLLFGSPRAIHHYTEASAYNSGQEIRKRSARVQRRNTFDVARSYAEPSPPGPYVPPPVMDGPLGRFLRDPTLRSDDVVATTAGLMVYRGAGGKRHHKESDFASVSAVKTSGRNHRNQILAIDRSLRIYANLSDAPDEPIVAADQQMFQR